MASRAHDWLDQAQRDLEHARNDLASGYHEWECYRFDHGKPGDYYAEADSRQAIGCAETVLRFCADCLSR